MVTAGPGFSLAALEIVGSGGAPPGLAALTPLSAVVAANNQVTLTVIFNSPVSVDTAVSLSSDSATAVTLPAQLIIPAGQSSGSFPVTGLAAGTCKVAATAGGVEVTSFVTVTP
jgi:hypothetical protein